MIKNLVRRSFMYSFKLKEDLPYIERLPDDVQASIERVVVKVIYESFVVPGDQDYLTARLLAQKGLPRAFFWAAAQCIEKYLKAFLLLDGHSVIDKRKFRGHPVKILFDDAAKVDNALRSIDLTPHVKINIEEDVRRHIKSFTIDSFIEDIDVHGSADNRYNSCGVEFNTGHLFALDNFAYALRGKIGVPSINDSFNNIHSDLISIFEANNPWFCGRTDKCHKSIPSEVFPIVLSSAVTTLDFLYEHKDESPYRHVLKWLDKKMKLPKRVNI